MANEILFSSRTESGNTLYAVILNSSGQAWNGSAFEAIDAGSWTDYDIALTEQDGTGIWLGDKPGAMAAGVYSVIVYSRSGASPAITDLDVGTGEIGGATLATAEYNTIADAVLTRDWTAVTGEAARSVLNALRLLRNKFSISGSTLTVTEEDDSTTAWTSALTSSSSADPITASDPS